MYSGKSLLPLIVLLLLAGTTLAQFNGNGAGSSEFNLYDNSHISPELRRKHSISLGVQNVFSTPFRENFIPKVNKPTENTINYNIGFHFGYDYLILKRRVRVTSAKGKLATEIKNGFGIHVSSGFQAIEEPPVEEPEKKLDTEIFANVSYYRPLIHLYIPIFRVYLFNEIGLGFHYNSRFKYTETKQFSPIVTFEPIRIRLFNSAMYFYGTTSWAFSNDGLGTIPLDVSGLIGVKIYFYKY